MDERLKQITEFARKVKRVRRAEQTAFNKLSKATRKTTGDLANEHEIAMIATSNAERALANLVIRLLVK